jgi:hypothetical protein
VQRQQQLDAPAAARRSPSPVSDSARLASAC